MILLVEELLEEEFPRGHFREDSIHPVPGPPSLILDQHDVSPGKESRTCKKQRRREGVPAFSLKEAHLGAQVKGMRDNKERE